MVVTLDQLEPYENDPRRVRNPRYEDILASIRERGLDSPPAITQRPGASHYIIRNGGNTRLAILKELWNETHDEQYFRIPCLFRPWPERGEIVALIGHLAENELRGSLTSIERAKGVEMARRLYEDAENTQLSQSELARRLKADGYPIRQQQISLMQEAIEYLLPSIPNLLYAGLGRPQVEKLTQLRKTAEYIWNRLTGMHAPATDFHAVFQETLKGFDGSGDAFSPQRVQDELAVRMAERLNIDYDDLEEQLVDPEFEEVNQPRGPAFHVKPQASHSSMPGQDFPWEEALTSIDFPRPQHFRPLRFDRIAPPSRVHEPRGASHLR
jgi:ParB family protein of integrating conjugative element (PFGI_1 class)